VIGCHNIKGLSGKGDLRKCILPVRGGYDETIRRPENKSEQLRDSSFVVNCENPKSALHNWIPIE
jgi:hypothetical protein